jgi:prepilin-type N-terminal cleavage/methylation domain-containing protein
MIYRDNLTTSRLTCAICNSSKRGGCPWRRSTESAFSLVEVMVATAMAAVFFAAVYTTLAFGFELVRVTRETLRATQILEQKLETIRLYSWDQITNKNVVVTNFVDAFYPLTNAPTGLTYTGSVAITKLPWTERYSNDVLLVSAQLQWKSGNVLRSRQMQTIWARYGLQNYIY